MVTLTKSHKAMIKREARCITRKHRRQFYRWMIRIINAGATQ